MEVFIRHPPPALPKGDPTVTSLRPARRTDAARMASVLSLAAALAAVSLLPGTATAKPVTPATATETGTLVELVADDFANGRARSEWALQRSNASFVALEGVGAADVRGLVGEQVRVTGRALGRHKLAVDAGDIAAADGGTSTTDTTTAPTAGAAATSRHVAVVMVNFADDAREPVTPTQVRTTLLGSTTDVDDHFQDSSDGHLGVTGDVLGWHTVDRATATSCDYAAWGNAASKAAAAAGADLGGYDHVMYFWPQQSACSWAGLGQLPGTTSWINGSNTTRVLAHELAHNLGEHHASAAGSCTEDGASVVVPTSTSSCTVSEYGDAFTIMGSSSYYLHTGASRVHLGWLEPVTAAAGEAGTWTLSPLDSGAGTRMVRIPRGDGTYLSLEFRQPHGTFDTFSSTSPIATGVTLRLDRGVGSKQTVLFDATPATATYGDAPLAAGRSVTDPMSGATVTVESVSSTGAQVAVSYGGDAGGGSDDGSGDGSGDPIDPGTDPTDTTAPTAVTRLKASVRKGGVTLSWRASSDDSGSVTYEVTRDGVTSRTTATRWSDRPGPGTWTYSVVATDAAGNASAPAQVTVTVRGSTATDGEGKGNGKGTGKRNTKR
jgi:hypothetical protein